jgi:hypothetical protein
LLLWLFVPADAQTVAPTVTFTLDFPGSAPSHYVVSISSDGHASYVSNGQLSNGIESDASDPWRLDFVASPSAIARVFDLAKRANYFEGEIDSKKKNLASTGVKTLTYKGAQKNTQAIYNYSLAAPVQELTAFFQSLSTTLEFGQRLEYYLRYQKLALDDELKRMEEMANKHELEELPVIAPILQKITDDVSVMKVVRARAQRLLEFATTASK